MKVCCFLWIHFFCNSIVIYLFSISLFISGNVEFSTLHSIVSMQLIDQSSIIMPQMSTWYWLLLSDYTLLLMKLPNNSGWNALHGCISSFVLVASNPIIIMMKSFLSFLLLFKKTVIVAISLMNHIMELKVSVILLTSLN